MAPHSSILAWKIPWMAVRGFGIVNKAEIDVFLELSCFFYDPADVGNSIFHSSAAAAKSLQSCPTLCNLIDGSPSGSPVPGIFQARTLEWVAISSPMHESEK